MTNKEVLFLGMPASFTVLRGNEEAWGEVSVPGVVKFLLW